MIRVMTIFGTRPEAIKMAPLVKELDSRENIESIVCVTAQHREMLDQVLDTFDIKPQYDLNIMKQGQTLTEITTRAMQKLDEVIKEVKPDIVLVHGDTTTTLSGSLTAFYNQVSVGHVEAGLRTYDKYSPFPEEVNRQATGIIADMHFSPTEVSKNNLLKENKTAKDIYVTGNTAIDALKTTVREDYTHPVLEKIGQDKMILLTAHRRENLGEPMRNMFKAIKRIIEDFDGIQVVYPVHLNPIVRGIANEVLGENEKVHLIEPLEVLDFHNFLNKSHIIMTDSGGIQEEAPSLGKPVLVLRDTTERPEGVQAGTLKLAGTEEETIYQLTKQLLEDEVEYSRMSKSSNPYGDGHASKYIVDAIIDKFENKAKRYIKKFLGGIIIVNIFERCLALIMLIILSPLLLLIAIIVRLDSKGEILFKQKRIGKNSKIFYIYKFRTMSDNSHRSVPSNELISENITKIGKYLRKTSLDELPQLINIIKGEMSFIGYRPVIPEETNLISLRKKYKIDENLPGLTGWAQINGRDSIDTYEKIEFERYYYQNKNTLFNIKIILMTICKVITRECVYD